MPVGWSVVSRCSTCSKRPPHPSSVLQILHTSTIIHRLKFKSFKRYSFSRETHVRATQRHLP